jgi:hypothetical protein
VTLSGTFVSALLEQGMFYWFGGELLEEVRVLYMSGSQLLSAVIFMLNTKML